MIIIKTICDQDMNFIKLSLKLFQV